MIRIVGYCFLLLCTSAWALVPVEGLIMGKSQTEIQPDSLSLIFQDLYQNGPLEERKKVKAYYAAYSRGVSLQESCGLYGPIYYPSSWTEKQAKRTVVSTLQYIGLDAVVKSI